MTDLSELSIDIKVLPNDISLCTLKGYLDGYTVDKFDEKIYEDIDAGIAKFIIDLEGLAYISSAGAGIFVEIASQLESREGKLVFLNVPPNIRNIFALVGLTQLFEFYDEEETAINSFK